MVCFCQNSISCMAESVAIPSGCIGITMYTVNLIENQRSMLNRVENMRYSVGWEFLPAECISSLELPPSPLPRGHSLWTTPCTSVMKIS
jgi:hypothetical protein